MEVLSTFQQAKFLYFFLFGEKQDRQSGRWGGYTCGKFISQHFEHVIATGNIEVLCLKELVIRTKETVIRTKETVICAIELVNCATEMVIHATEMVICAIVTDRRTQVNYGF